MEQDCLRLFSKEERLTDNNKVFCRHCKAHRDSTKKLEIWKVPPIVLVHLKRYVRPLSLGSFKVRRSPSQTRRPQTDR
jgi:ubiquitin C-terminal hydrolase